MKILNQDIIELLKEYFISKNSIIDEPDLIDIKTILSSFQNIEKILERYSHLLIENETTKNLIEEDEIYFNCRFVYNPEDILTFENKKEYEDYLSLQERMKFIKEIQKETNQKWNGMGSYFYKQGKKKEHYDNLGVLYHAYMQEKLCCKIKDEILGTKQGENTFELKILRSKATMFMNKFKNNPLIEWGWIPWSDQGITNEYNFDWTLENIEAGKDNWDWDHLMQNKGIKWDFKLINRFKDYINWKSLSKNLDVKWTLELIRKYRDKIDFKSLSENTKIDWNIDTIVELKDLLDFNLLTKNDSIIWSIEMIEKFKAKISFFNLAKFSVLSEDVILTYKNEWNRNNTEKFYQRHSLGSYWHYTHYSLWEYLGQNTNIIWTDNIIDNCINEMSLHNLNHRSKIRISVKLLNKYWSYSKEEATSKTHDYDGREKIAKEVIFFRERVKNCELIDLDLEKFRKNELKWWGVLVSKKFINDSIKKKLLESKVNDKI